MKPDSGIGIAAPWLIFMAYWLIAGLRTNQTARQEPVSDRLARLIVMIIAFLLLYEKESVLGLLNRRCSARRLDFHAWLGAFVPGCRIRDLGALPHREILEQHGLAARRPRTDSYRSLRADSPSDLYRPAPYGIWHRPCGWTISRSLCICDCFARFHLEIETRGSAACRAVWSEVRGASSPHRILPPEVLMNAGQPTHSFAFCSRAPRSRL